MGVVRNLMIRIGADYSEARHAMQGASRQLNHFSNNTHQASNRIRNDFRNLGRSATSSFSAMTGSGGIGGVVAGLATLRPAVQSAITGLTELTAATAGTTAALGPAGLAIGAVTVALGLMVTAIGMASQEAIRFEANMGRLQMQLQGGTRSFMGWADSVGLAKSSAANMGATYGTLMSSFTKNTDQIAKSTQQLVQTTRVVASATGRTIDDVTERIRSGLLGNTEAIEDLGIFVNVSMIESTKAFKKFANGKHWEQLDFRVQQQIRLAAILEQAYDRYGDSLQNNVMTKQTNLVEQFKDIKLNLSQAFLPIWDTILPALTKMASALAEVTEQLARFTYWLRGWDYDEKNMGIEGQTDAVTNLGDSYEKTGEQAKKAKSELASFDRLNLIGPNGDISGGGSGGGTPGAIDHNPHQNGSSDNGWEYPVLPPLPRLHLEFDPPKPPDAGLGAVVSLVKSKVNELSLDAQKVMASMWAQLDAITVNGVTRQLQWWNSMNVAITGVTIPSFSASSIAQWNAMWNSLLASAVTNSILIDNRISSMLSDAKVDFVSTSSAVRVTWQTMLDGLLADLMSAEVNINSEWESLKAEITSVKVPLTDLKTWWHSTLEYLFTQMKAYRPALEDEWNMVSTAIRNLTSPLAEVKIAWSDTLSDMYTTAQSKLSGVISKINDTVSAWSRLGQATGASVKAPTVNIPRQTSPVESPSPVTDTGRAEWVDKNPVLGPLFQTLDNIGERTEPVAAFLRQYLIPGAGGYSMARGAGQAIKGLGSRAAATVSGWLDNLGIALPAFATGAVVYGPTLAMVGDNKGAMTNPEVIAPLSDLENIMGNGGGNEEEIAVLQAILQAVRENRTVQAVISANEVTRTAIDGINNETRRTGRTPLNI